MRCSTKPIQNAVPKNSYGVKPEKGLVANHTASYNFFARLILNSLIRDKAPDPLEVVREFNLSLKAASDLGQDQRAADNHSTDNLANGGLLS
jgi:hypothetical protein